MFWLPTWPQAGVANTSRRKGRGRAILVQPVNPRTREGERARRDVGDVSSRRTHRASLFPSCTCRAKRGSSWRHTRAFRHLREPRSGVLDLTSDTSSTPTGVNGASNLVYSLRPTGYTEGIALPQPTGQMCSLPQGVVEHRRLAYPRAGIFSKCAQHPSTWSS